MPRSPQKAGSASTSAAGRTASNRQHWSALPVEKRREIQRIYEQLGRLSAEQRELLLEKLAALDRERRRAVLRRAREDLEGRAAERTGARSEQSLVDRHYRELRREWLGNRLKTFSPAERERLRSMPLEERRRYVERKARQAREKTLSRLAPLERERVRRLPPREQVQYLRELRGRQVLHATFRRPREIEALRQLAPRRLAELLRPRREGRTLERPQFLSAAAWDRWLRLEPYERARVLRLLRTGDKTPRSTRGRRTPSPQGTTDGS